MIAERLEDMSKRPEKWTEEDYATIAIAYRQADQATKDAIWALLRPQDGIIATVDPPH
jgi:hypothetical protein